MNIIYLNYKAKYIKIEIFIISKYIKYWKLNQSIFNLVYAFLLIFTTFKIKLIIKICYF